MSNKDIKESNELDLKEGNPKVTEVEYARNWCEVCEAPFFHRDDGFCSDACASEVHPWQCDQCGKYYTTGYDRTFCSESCMIEWSDSDKAQEMLFDWIGIRPKNLEDHIKVNNLRTGKTLPLRR
jgi:predicted nucleic acid-binding Zn ribbon protein